MYFLALTGILSRLLHSTALLLRPCGAPCRSIINTHTSHRIEVLAEPVHFTSPDFPNSKNQSVTYYYSIQSRSDSDSFRGLRLRSATFNVGKSLANYPYCEESDSLVVWDAHYLEILPYYAMGIFCGNQTLDIITYSPNAVLMYRTTNRYASPGFNITITRACGLRHFECPSKRTVCIAYHHICDGINDCPEGEDEICTTQCGVPPISSSEVSAPVRIVGGTESDPHTWPWQAHLAIWYSGRDKGSGSTCGGSLIGPEWVITAAHCCADMGDRAADVWCFLDKTAFPPFHIVEASDIDVTLGIHNVNEKNKDNTYQVKAVIVHPRYNPLESFQCDYCFLQLDKTVQFNDKIQPICLPRYPDPIRGATCYATGFGKTRQRDSQEQVRDPLPSVPLQVDLSLMGPINCSRSVGTGGSNMLSLTPDMACANSSNKETAKDTCSGDSGGPLSCRVPNSIPLQWQLYGSTSWGYGCASGTPGVYARLRTALAFLADILYAAKRVGWFSNTTVPVINWEIALQQSPEEYELTIKKIKGIYVLSGKRLAFTISTYLLAILIHVI